MTAAAYYREYRRQHADELREYNRARRARPEVRAQRHAQELRRRARIRASRPAEVEMRHPLLDAAAALVVMPPPGRVLRFRREVMAEDARSEAVLALVEGRDPLAAVRAFRAVERTWGMWTVPLFILEGAA
jgi:hypothetical protein